MEKIDNYTIKEKREIAKIIAECNLKFLNEGLEDVAYKESIYSKYIKRIIDIIISLPLFVLVLPINVLLFLITIFDVGFPVFYTQIRIGMNEKPFKFRKYRNMTNDVDCDGRELKPKERVTRWGRFARKTSLDELLNFWYVLIGDMSIIGPRPMPYDYLERFNKRHRKRTLVKPGLECPPHSKKYMNMGWEERFENDIWYVENISFITDCKLFFLLIKETLFSKRKLERGSAEVGAFMGYEKNGKIITSECIPAKYIVSGKE